jgi:hypothetical protein
MNEVQQYWDVDVGVIPNLVQVIITMNAVLVLKLLKYALAIV